MLVFLEFFVSLIICLCHLPSGKPLVTLTALITLIVGYNGCNVLGVPYSFFGSYATNSSKFLACK
jgi:hypothetical protein